MAECRTIQSALERLEAAGCTKVAVVRLFVRSESFESRIEYLLGLREAAEKRIRERVRQAEAEGLRTIVVPYRVAGYDPYRDVLDGCVYEADGRGFCPDPRMTALIQRRLREVESPSASSSR